jgi:16S rRNA (uracil1498-N3)-methyltransferase
VNLILFEPSEIERPLPRSDRRAIHILEVLRRKAGDTFDAGVINGMRGTATLRSVTAASLVLTFNWTTTPAPPRDPITLLIGLPRPQTARDILRDATTLGVSAIHFTSTEKSERSYARSTLWTSGEWRRYVVIGAEQAFDTRIPEVTHDRSLPDVLGSLATASTRVAFDVYEAEIVFGNLDCGRLTVLNPHLLAFGGERGWSGKDRDILRAHGFNFVHLGRRVLRTETAVVAALSILRAKSGLM